MANSSRVIIRGVRVNNKTYTSGMEDELAKVIKPADAERLVNKGHLEGAWPAAKQESAPKAPTGNALKE